MKRGADDDLVALVGRRLEPGRHAVELGGIRIDLLVGAKAGPRAFVLGGLDGVNDHAAAAVRATLAAIDPAELSGSVAMIAHANTGSREVARVLVELGCDLGVELRGGDAGWATAAHVRADLSDRRARDLVREFAAEIVLDVRPARGSLRRALARAGVPMLCFEAGEVGRVDPEAIRRAMVGVLDLLRAERMLTGAAGRPPWRVIVGGVKRLRARRGGRVVPVALPGDRVAAGALLVEIDGAPLSAPRAAVVLGIAGAAICDGGDPIVRLGAIVRSTRRGPTVDSQVAGWCEWVALPELGVGRLEAKLDTGARTSALHVLTMKEIGEVDGRVLLEIRIPGGRRHARVVAIDHVTVKNSAGDEEHRPVIETLLVMGRLRRRVRVTLTDRADMVFPMLIGRSALGEGFHVDAAAKNLLGKPRG